MEERSGVLVPVLETRWEISAEDMTCDRSHLKGRPVALEGSVVNKDRTVLGRTRNSLELAT